MRWIFLGGGALAVALLLLRIFLSMPPSDLARRLRLATGVALILVGAGLLFLRQFVLAVPVAMAGLIVEALGARERPEVAAARLYAALRALDDLGVDAIVARMPEERGLGAALRDRLRRAASGRVLDG